MRRWIGNEDVGDSPEDWCRDLLDDSDVHALDEDNNYRWYEEMNRWTTTYSVPNIMVDLALQRSPHILTYGYSPREISE